MAYSIDDVHAELLVLLERLHVFCRENGIVYSLHGGTMLGAVREHGFIAWDDDADVTFSRSEYDRFVQLAAREFSSGQVRLDEDSRYPKLVMKREGRPVVWVDFFVYDYIASDPFRRKLKMLGTQFHILATRTKNEQALSNSHGVHGGLGKLVMNAVVGIAGIFPYKMRLASARRFMKAFPGERAFVHRSNDTNVGMRMILPARVLDETVPVPFETLELDVYRDYDAVLRSSYGPNYMTPVKDKSDATHEISLNMEREYFLRKFFQE